MIPLLILALATYAAPQQATCDIIEINHAPNFTQLIFWQWSEQRRRHDVRGWKIIDNDSMIPRRTRGGFVATWHECGVRREVRAGAVRETRTQYDREMREREQIAEADRVPMFASERVEQ